MERQENDPMFFTDSEMAVWDDSNDPETEMRVDDEDSQFRDNSEDDE